MSQIKQNQVETIKVVYCVTSYGKIVGTYSNSDDAFQCQMSLLNKGRLAELIPQPIIYPLNDKSNE